MGTPEDHYRGDSLTLRVLGSRSVFYCVEKHVDGPQKRNWPFPAEMSSSSGGTGTGDLGLMNPVQVRVFASKSVNYVHEDTWKYRQRQ
jgi:hypothetical protein